MSKFFIADPGIAECAGAAGVADQLRGRVGSSGLASARGRPALSSFAPLARARERARAAPPPPRVWPGGGCSICGVLFAELRNAPAPLAWPISYGVASARAGSRARAVGLSGVVRALIFGPDFIHWRRSGES